MRVSARTLIDEVAQSRAEFEARWRHRAEVLARQYAIFRFCQCYRELSGRFQRRFKRPLNKATRFKPIRVNEADKRLGADAKYSDWRADAEFQLDERGRPLPTVRNILAALDLDPAFANLIKYDPEAKKYWLMGPVPGDWWTENVAPVAEPKFLNTEDVTQIRAYLEGPTVGLVGISHDDVLAAVRLVGKRYAFGGEV